MFRSGELRPAGGQAFLCGGVITKLRYRFSALRMVGLVEIHSYKSGGFYLWHVPVKEARHKEKELWAKGYVVTFTKNI